MQSSVNKIYKTRARKAIVGEDIVWITALIYVVIAISSIWCIVSFIKGTPNIISMLISAFCLVYLVIVGTKFDWFKEGKATITSYGELQYEETGVFAMFGNTVSRYVVTDITDIKTKGDVLIIYGDVTEVDELKKQYKKSKVRIQGYCKEHHECLIRDIENLMYKG